MAGKRVPLQGAQENLWDAIVSVVNKHNKYVREGRTETQILELYWRAMGMIETAKILGTYDLPKLKLLEARMYKPYEK